MMAENNHTNDGDAIRYGGNQANPDLSVLYRRTQYAVQTSHDKIELMAGFSLDLIHAGSGMMKF